MAALTLGLALLFMLVVVDSGRLYLEKRKLQRVADVSALEAANLRGTCIPTAPTAVTYGTQSATRNGFTVSDNTRGLAIACGTLTTGANSRRVFAVDPTKSEAIRVIVSHQVPTSIAAGIASLFSSEPSSPNITLTATAVAATSLPPLAQLNIRSTLLSASIGADQAGALSKTLGSLLGANVTLDAVSWKGLVDTDVSLLKFMDQLAIQLGIQAGQYDQVLAASASVGQLVTAAANALQQGGQTVSAAAAVTGLLALNTAVAGISQPGIKLGDLLNIKTGTPAAGLDTGLQVFQLVQGIAQLANTKNGAYISQTISIPEALSISVKIKVIEPPQFSAIGDPALAKAAPLGADKIYVRTAQTRALIKVQLPALGGLMPTLNGVVNGLLGPLTGTLNRLLTLDLSAVGCLLGTTCTQTNILLLPGNFNLDIGLDLASSSSYVTDFNCATDASKTLTTQTTTAVATLKAGVIDETAFFSSANPSSVKPVTIVDIGTQACKNLLLIPLSCDPRVPFAGGGLGLLINSSVVGNGVGVSYVYPQPPELNKTSAYKDFSSTNIVASLKDTLAGISINQYAPTGQGSLLGNLLGQVTNVLAAVTKLVSDSLSGILSKVLDPVLNNVLASLGIDIAKVTVGANLSCHPGQAKLVI
jgi:uncharacterized membrane protein